MLRIPPRGASLMLASMPAEDRACTTAVRHPADRDLPQLRVPAAAHCSGHSYIGSSKNCCRDTC